MLETPPVRPPRESGDPGGATPDAHDVLTFRCPASLRDKLDAWIASQPDPRPSRDEALRRFIAAGLAEAPATAAYRATRNGPNGPLDEWRAEAKDDEDAAHRLAQRLKTRLEQRAEGYAPEDLITLIRPDGEIVTIAAAHEMIERLSGWKTTAAEETHG